MPETIQSFTSTTSNLHMSEESRRIFQVKEELGILDRPADEDIVNLLCLRIYDLEEKMPCEGDTVLSEEEMEDLNGRLHKDSSNSSKPPRTDFFNRPHKEADEDQNDEEKEEGEEEHQHTEKRSLRTPSGRKPGKQVGAEGHGLKKPENAEIQDTVYHMHHDCEHCSQFKECKLKAVFSAVRHVYDVKVTTTDTPHVTVTCECPEDGSVKSGEFPKEVNSTQQYGSQIKALVLVLSVLGMVSIDRIHEILSAVCNLPLSTGSIQKWIEEGGEKVQPVLERIKEVLRKVFRLHADETGVHLNGKLMWIHTACNELFTCLSLQEKRGYEGACAAGILPYFTGILIHDCWSSYWKFIKAVHGLCCAHLQRELNWVIQFKKKNREWAQALFDLLNEMNTAVQQAKSEGKERLEKEILRGFSARYDKWINEGLRLNPAPKESIKKKRGRKKNGKVRSLLLRMQEHKDEVLLFATNFDATFSNNCAEASFRLIAQKRSIIGGFRSEKGAHAFIDMFSYLSSCRKHNINCYEAMLALEEGRAVETLFPQE